MTKQAFMNEFSTRLSALEETLRNEIVADIAEHFAEGAAHGVSEEEICRNLGQPSTVADQFIEEYAAKTPEAYIDGFDISALEIPPFNAASTSAPEMRFPEQEAPNTNGPSGKSTGSAIPPEPVRLSFFENASYNININKTFNHTAKIRIDLKNSHLTIRPADRLDMVTVQVKGRARHDHFVVDVCGDELLIIENIIKPTFNFLFSASVQLETVLYVPSNFAGAIHALIGNGAVAAMNVNGSELWVKNSARDIKINGCRFKYFDVQGTAGNAELADNTCETFKVLATAGDIHIDNCSGTAHIVSTAGNLQISGHRAGNIQAKARAGDIKIIDCSGGIDVKSSAGTVKIICEGKILQDVYARSSAGDIKLEAAETQRLDLTSSAGKVKASVGRVCGDINLRSSAGNVKLEAHSVAGNIEAKASTGSVRLYLPREADCRIEASTRAGKVTQNVRGNEHSRYVLRASASMGSVTINPID